MTSLTLIVLLLAATVRSQDQTAAADTTAADTLAADTRAADTLAVVEPDESDVGRARKKLELLDITRQQAEDLLDRSKVATGESRDLLRVEALRIVDDLSELSDDVLKILSSLEVGSAFADSVRNALGNHLSYQANIYTTSARRVIRNLADMRHRRPNIAAKELADFETQIGEERSRLDFAMRLVLDVATRLDAVEWDTLELWENFDDLLIERAQNLSTRLQFSVTARERIKGQIKAAERIGASEQVVDERARLQAVEHRVTGLVASLGEMIKLLNRRELDSSGYRQTIIQVTGEVTEDLLDPKVLLGLAQDVLDTIVDWLRDSGPTLLFRIALVILFILIFQVGARVAWILAMLVLRPSKLLKTMVGRMLRPLAGLAGLLVGFWFIGANPATLLAGLGVAGLVLGLALQDSLGNLAAGVFILVYRPYDESDVVRVGGVLGTVKEMGLANTTIITFDNRRLFVPNRKVWSEVIENRSAERTRRVDTVVRISYQEDIEKAIVLIRKILSEHELVLSEPSPQVFVSSLADSWVEIAVWPWTVGSNWWGLTTDLPKAIRLGLENGGVEIPYPRQEIDLSSNAGSSNPGRDRQAEEKAPPK